MITARIRLGLKAWSREATATTIDRLLGAIGQRFAVAPDASRRSRWNVLLMAALMLWYGFSPDWRLLTLPLFMALSALMMFAFGLMIANFTALAMEPQGHIAGTASSLYGSITTLLGIGIGFAAWTGAASAVRGAARVAARARQAARCW